MAEKSKPVSTREGSPTRGGSPRAEREEKILSFWKEHNIFEKTLEKEASRGEFVFYEGPPTANGRPGIHHVEARSFKDAIPRYKTMRGYHVRRKAGWDTHGLPVELEVEKQLGLKSKKEIEEYGIDKFNEECKKSVWKYVDEWRRFSDRMGYWVDLDNPYVTYHNSYIESVWSILAHVNKRGLLYKDYKVVPWCPRCGTALSSHELAQGYQDVKDISLYVKFKIVGQENTYLVAWTTTPWTLPGNVALAVGENIKYAKYNWAGENFIVAKDRASKWPGHIQEEFLGKDLVGLQYESLYDFAPKNENSHKVYAADFVTTDDGTGIVHTAVMYGQDDFVLGNKIGLPKHHLVEETGHFKPETGFLAGKSVVEESTAVEILKDLQNRGLLLEKESYTHSYPFCWRCKTKLIYYARDSWYIAMSRLRDELVSENNKINWEPDYIKEGRFGEWLREVKDWAVSRERYWGTPLPVWQTMDGSKKIVIDSLEVLKEHTVKSGNEYYVMRHGEADNNKLKIVSCKKENEHHLTEEGKEQVKASARGLRDKNIDLIISSPFIRTRETAQLVASVLNLATERIVYDERLREYEAGVSDGQPEVELKEFFQTRQDLFVNKPEGGENFNELKNRVGEFLYETDSQYEGKNILIITHRIPAWLLAAAAEGLDPDGANKIMVYMQPADVRKLPFIPLPHNAHYELDLHRPYIDGVVLTKNGENYSRIKEVIDVWFDSGAMPFAQDHYPFEIEEPIYPADFIAEAIDQTRGWFYTLHAIGILMQKGIAYKNVISLGHLLDKEGKKMSKSVGNVVDPWEMMDKYGIDTLRLWMYSVNQPGDNKNFDERSVDEIQKRVFNILDNVYSFYELYRDPKLEPSTKQLEASNVLDQWILSRLNQLVDLTTSKLDEYKLLEPVRAMREFIDDLSTWYLRRSRDRIKEGDEDAKATLYSVLKTVSKLLAPFAPFAAEDLYQKLKTSEDPMSVHLTDWPKAGGINDKILQNMVLARRIVSEVLMTRNKQGINVRQPLRLLKIQDDRLEKKYEYHTLIKDEINVKEVAFDRNMSAGFDLDIIITPELKEEGLVREAIRLIQDLRKEAGLRPKDQFTYEVPKDKIDFFKKHEEEIIRATSSVLSHLHD